jgi:hypothetical protein
MILTVNKDRDRSLIEELETGEDLVEIGPVRGELIPASHHQHL